MSIYNIKEYGAIGDGEAVVTTNIQQAIDDAYTQGGGQVYIPAGIFKTGSLTLKDNVELHISSGAILSFSTDPKDYGVVNSRWEGWEKPVYASCLYAKDSQNIAVSGFGTIEGNGSVWWDVFRNHRDDLKYPRPKTISFEECSNITIRDITILNSPSWTLNPIKCHNITIDNINIKNPKDSPNTDGIDPESCTNVRITNCNIDVGDDCIALKSGVEDTPERVSSENIVISNCTMVHGHGGVVIGSEMSGDIRNVTITNCVFQDTDRGIRIKSRRGRGGTVEDIRISNIIMDNVMCPFVMNLFYFCGPRGKDKYVWDKNPYPITIETPTFRRIHMANITARNCHARAGFIYGLPENAIEDITFDNINIAMIEEAIPGQAAMATGVEKTTHKGFYIGNAKDIQFNRVTLENIEGPGFLIEDSTHIEVLNCTRKNGRDNAPLVVQ